MRDLVSLTSKTLLRVRTPESLFSYSPSEAKAEYRALVRRWHPDREPSPDAPIVLDHITNLYRLACTKVHESNWHEPCEKVEDETPGVKRFRMRGGSIKQCEFLKAHSFEFGQAFIGSNYVTFEVDEEYADFFRNGRKQIQSLRFQNADMAAEMSKYLPQIVDHFSTENSHIMVLRKTPDQVLLGDVVRRMGGTLNPIAHIGWIVNALYNVACYLEWSGITHNAIAKETIFISPLRHSVMLLGGWWYSAGCGSRLKAVPNRTLDCLPYDVMNTKCADSRVDLELIKLLGRELLGGDKSLVWEDDSIPESIVKWLSVPTSGSAKSDYKEWKQEVLVDAFGPPHFVKLNLNSSDLYKEI